MVDSAFVALLAGQCVGKETIVRGVEKVLASFQDYLMDAPKAAEYFAVMLKSLVTRMVRAVLSCAVLCCPVLSCAVLCCPVLSCAVLCCPVLSCAVLCCPVLSCPVLSCAVLSCAALSRSVLCRVVLCCPVLRCADLCCAVLCCAVSICAAEMFLTIVECRCDDYPPGAAGTLPPERGCDGAGR
jgi:hypothetical protein